MADDEEEDYMSDAFLKQLPDVRPGLRTKSQKRKKALKNESAPRPKKMKTSDSVMSKTRDEALSIPLSSDNKGFALLQKMGYKKGMGLGKSSEGRTAPIPIVLKEGRVGLGRERFLQEKRVLKKVVDAKRVSDFQQQKQEMFSSRKAEIDLRKSQQACQQLDSQMDVFIPEQEWFWPPGEGRRDEDEEYEDEEDSLELEPSEKLAILTQHLRSNHFYCIWCGTQYEDARDMQLNCPGDTEEAHE